LTAAALAVTAASLALAAGAQGALIAVFRDSMETTAQRSQLVKLSGASCARGGSTHALRVVLGKKTKECSYRTPVIGRDLEIAATLRLLSITPKPAQHSAFLALNLRTGGGGRYQLAVFPLQRKAQLRKLLPGGTIEYLKIQKNVKAIQGLNAANPLRLRAFNVTSGPDKGKCRIRAFVGAELVGESLDRAGGELQGRASGFSLGAAGSAKGTAGSADDVVVRTPNPF
jgi:hypothetical protein